ncbi:MAG: DUF349 domain-containing protein [Bacteroidales bacterium]|nr:DUF349 domain-containing protein [Bacteroidales bacterium]
MEENKNLENVENENVENTEKKKSSAEILLEKLQQRKTIEQDGLKKVEELKKISEEVKTIAVPDTVLEKEDDEEIAETPIKELPNYNDFTREQLVEALEQLIQKPYDDIKEEGEIIKNTFYRKRNAEIVEKRDKFIEEGGEKADFKIDPDELDNKFKELFDRFKDLKQKRNEEIEEEKKKNLERKNEIIEKIEELITKGETLNKTFDDFHKYRDEWDKIGIVAQSDAKTLLEKYNFTLQKFYDWVKINKELRDLDLRKNLEQKIRLCEQTETLILEPKITKAYKMLQNFHDKWKEIGPVPQEKKEEIWDRFKEASALINKKHYTYFQEIKDQQQDNLKAKELLSEEAENIANEQYASIRDWQIKTDEMNELMKLWKLIGFAPKKNNNQIFERFIAARKLFFDNKHEFFQNYTEILNKNLQIKEQLVIEAENLKNSTDWNKTSDLMVELQKKWKQIGPVPNDKKDDIWTRFNAACNGFFEAKRDHFKNRKEEEQENLKLKKEIIEKITNLEANEDANESLKQIQQLQKEWSNIGYVPFKVKDSIYQEYHKAIEEKYKTLDISKSKRREVEQKAQYDNLISSNEPYKIRYEMEKVKNNIDNFHKEILTLENNISFFVKSKNAEGIIKNFEEKINKLKEQKENNEKILITLNKALKESQK